MSAGVLLALLPSAGIIAGLFLGLGNRCLRFAGACLAIYLLALIDLYFLVPVYSTVKATYLLGLTPLFGLLFAAGCRPLLRFKPLRVFIYAEITLWAVLSYSAFFIV